MINGIEYWAFANSLDKQSKSLEKRDLNQAGNSERERRKSEILNVHKCPNFLLPNLVCKNQKIDPNNTSQKDLNAIGNKNKLSKLNYTDDFILLSEFSEIEGPKPLLTIPIDGGTDFNKNEYSLHLMCVDFHSNLQQVTSSHSNVECSSEQTNNQIQNETKFALTSDTSIINYWDSNSTVSSCICHFTLYDLNARGFVRPFCLAYISYDHEKPIKLFEQIRESFGEVTSLFKKSNLNLFKNELQQMYTDLKYTQELFIKWSSRIKIDMNNPKEELDHECLLDLLALAKEYNLDANTFHKLNQACKNANNKHLQMSTIENTIREIEQILKIVVNELKKKNWLNKSCFDGQISSDQLLSYTFNNETDPYLQKYRSFTYPLTVEIDSNRTSNKNEYTNNGNTNPNHYLKRPKIVKNVLIANIGHLKIEASLEEMLRQLNENLEEQSTKSASTTSSSKQLHHHKVMKTLKELCASTEKQAIQRLVQMQKYYSTPYYLIKFDESTHEKSKSKKLTKKKTRFNMGKKLFWSITVGDCDIADFSKHINIADHNKSALISKKNFETIEQNFYADSKPTNMFMFKKDENNLSVTGNDNEMNKLSYDQSVSTQFYSPENTEQRIGTTQVNDTKSTTTGHSLIYDTAISVINCSLENEEKTKINQLETSTSLLVLNNSAKQITHGKILESIDQAPNDILNQVNENEDIADKFNDEDDDDSIAGFYSDIATNEQTSLEKNSFNEEFAYPICYDDFVNSTRQAEIKKKIKKNQNDDLLNLNEQDIEYDFADSLLSGLNEQRLSSISAKSMASASWNSNYLNKKFESNNQNICHKKLVDSLAEINEFNFEETLKKLVNRPYFTNLLYSLLKGRPVICLSRYCDELDQLNRIVYCLSNFVPNSFHCLNKITCKQLNKCFEKSGLNFLSSNSTANSSEQTSPKYTSSPLNINEESGFKNNDLPKLYEIFERKPIKLNDLKQCKLFGLNLLFARNECCSFECKNNFTNSNPSRLIHQHKHYHLNKQQQEDDGEILLKFVPISIRNYVSILDLDRNKFTGPVYKGDYLTQCVQKCKSFKQDSICFMYIITNPVYNYAKMAFLYKYSKSFDEFYISFYSAKKKNSIASSSSATQFDDRQKKRVVKNDELLSAKFYSINENEAKAETHSIHSQTSSSSPTILASQLNEMMNLTECDLKIIIYLLRTLKIKQLYLYNLALHKKQMKKLFKQTDLSKRSKTSDANTQLVKISTDSDMNSSSIPVAKPTDILNVYFNTNIQLPLLVDYEEVSVS